MELTLKRGNQLVLIAAKPDLRVQSKSAEPIHSSRFGIELGVKFADNLCRYQVAHVYIIEIPFEILDQEIDFSIVQQTGWTQCLKYI